MRMFEVSVPVKGMEFFEVEAESEEEAIRKVNEDGEGDLTDDRLERDWESAEAEELKVRMTIEGDKAVVTTYKEEE